MTDLASSDVTLTIEDRSIEGKKKRNRVKIAFGDGALTYPSGGVPLPTFGSWGMYRNLDYILLSDMNDAAGILWKYDQDNNKLRGYQSAGSAAAMAEISGAVAAQVLYSEAVGW